jgi:lactoylglutathione lyase
MAINAVYTHTNLTGRDWERLVRFYCDVFGCIPKPPQRDLSGEWLARLTALNAPHLRGMHLLLPGGGPNGPTLEIFAYDQMNSSSRPVVNEPGFGHIAFHVDDVDAAVQELVRHGGSLVGEIVKNEVAGVGLLWVAYARDPEGNIVELQNWKKHA